MKRFFLLLLTIISFPAFSIEPGERVRLPGQNYLIPDVSKNHGHYPTAQSACDAAQGIGTTSTYQGSTIENARCLDLTSGNIFRARVYGCVSTRTYEGETVEFVDYGGSSIGDTECWYTLPICPSKAGEVYATFNIGANNMQGACGGDNCALAGSIVVGIGEATSRWEYTYTGQTCQQVNEGSTEPLPPVHNDDSGLYDDGGGDDSGDDSGGDGDGSGEDGGGDGGDGSNSNSSASSSGGDGGDSGGDGGSGSGGGDNGGSNSSAASEGGGSTGGSSSSGDDGSASSSGSGDDGGGDNGNENGDDEGSSSSGGSGGGEDEEGDGQGGGDGEGDCDPEISDCEGEGEGGNCDPETEECGEGETDGGNCSKENKTPPTCDGDAIQCAIQEHTWLTQCDQLLWQEDLAGDDEYNQGDSLLDDPNNNEANAIQTEEHDHSNAFDIDDSGFLGGGACPAPESIAIFGGTIEISYEFVCELASLIRPIIIAIGYFIGALLFLRAYMGS